jgi:hypothetical protein
MNKRSRNKAKTKGFELMINGNMVEVRATPYLVNGEETRFRVSFNESPVYTFAWDREMNGIVVVEGKDSIPERIERAISHKLQQFDRLIAA